MMTFARCAIIGAAVMTVMASPAVAQDYAQIRIHNNTKEAILFLHSRISNTDDWGDDMLGDNAISETIPSGESVMVDVNNDPTCRMDFRAADGWGGEVEVRNVNVCSETVVVFND